MDTRMSIIEAAGELFAEQGYAGTSIRAITRKAGVFLSAVNYHFGSKEQLLLETIRYITNNRVLDGLAHLLEEDAPFDSVASFHGFVFDVIHGFLRTFLLSEDPPWCGKLFIRTRFDLSLELREELFAQAGHRKQFVRLAKQAMPEHPESLIQANIQSAIGILHNFVLSWKEIRDAFGDSDEPERIRRAAHYIARRVVAITEVMDDIPRFSSEPSSKEGGNI